MIVWLYDCMINSTKCNFPPDDLLNLNTICVMLTAFIINGLMSVISSRFSISAFFQSYLPDIPINQLSIILHSLQQ